MSQYIQEEIIVMKSIIKALHDLPMLVKVILALPALDVVWVVYRLLRSLDKNNILGVVIAVLAIFVGLPWLWLVDILCIVLKGDVWWID